MKIYNLMLCGLLMAVCSCADDDNNSNNEYTPLSLPAAQSRVSEQANDFSLSLFDAVIDNQGDENVLISPVSANIALSMIDNAVTGPGRNELTSVLGFGDDIESLNAFNKSLINYLPSADKTAELYLPNSFWYILRGVKSEFKNKMSDIYFAPSINTSYDNFAKDINKWISDKTKGNITDFLDDNEVGDFAFVNCLYFKGIWTSPFKNSATKPHEFYNFDNTTSKVDFLCGEKAVENVGGEHFSAVSLKFGNKAFSFDIFLPDEGYTTEDVMADLKENGIPEFQYYKRVNIRMPKISMSNKIDLIPVMQAMGVNRIFSGDNFSDLIELDRETAITLFSQANNLKLDEEGVVVATATTAIGVVSSPGPAQDNFEVNRPFIFFVREQSTNSILLAGRINKL